MVSKKDNDVNPDLENAKESVDAKVTPLHQEIVAEGEVKEVDHQKEALAAAQKAEQEILYIRAEYDNYKKRMIREQDQAIKMANKNMVSELLSVLDLFEHAIVHSTKLKAKGDAEVTNFVTGIEMTRTELVQMMHRFGVELVGEPGEMFDPAKHEAISEIEAADKPANSVLTVVQKGCVLQGKLLKPARVVVVKASS